MYLSGDILRDLIEHKVIKVEPFNPKYLQGNSLLLTSYDTFSIEPHEHKNVWTFEKIALPPYIYGILTARSSIARKGAFFATSIGVDSGFSGHLIVEFFNVSDTTLTFKKGTPIVHFLATIVAGYTRPYQGQYQNQAPGDCEETGKINRRYF